MNIPLYFYFRQTLKFFNRTAFAGLLLWRQRVIWSWAFMNIWLVWALLVSASGEPWIATFSVPFFFVLWPLATVLSLFLFVCSAAGCGKLGFICVYLIMPTGLSSIVGRFMIIVLVFFIVYKLLKFLWRLSLVCLENGLRMSGLLFISFFFYLHFTWRYSILGVIIRAFLEILFELTSLLYWIWSRFLAAPFIVCMRWVSNNIFFPFFGFIYVLAYMFFSLGFVYINSTFLIFLGYKCFLVIQKWIKYKKLLALIRLKFVGIPKNYEFVDAGFVQRLSMERESLDEFRVIYETERLKKREGNIDSLDLI